MKTLTKRVSVLFLACAMALSMAACSGGSRKGTTSSSRPTTSQGSSSSRKSSSSKKNNTASSHKNSASSAGCAFSVVCCGICVMSAYPAGRRIRLAAACTAQPQAAPKTAPASTSVG